MQPLVCPGVARASRLTPCTQKIGIARPGIGGNGNLTSRLLFQQPRSRNMVRMGMGIGHQFQRQAELTQHGQVTGGLFEYRVDENGFAAALIGQQIGVGGGGSVIQLSENHGQFPLSVAAILSLRR